VYQNEPKIFMGSDGQPSGILGELLVEMAKREGWTLRPVRCEWQACLDALKDGKLDLMPDVAFNEQRDTVFDFHKVPALLSWSQIYKHSGITINSALDLRDKRIAVLEGSVQQSYLRDLLSGFGVQAELVPVKSLGEGFDLALRAAWTPLQPTAFLVNSRRHGTSWRPPPSCSSPRSCSMPPAVAAMPICWRPLTPT